MYRILEWNPQLHPYVGAIEHRMQDRVRFETAEKVVFFLRYSGLCIDFELYFLQIVHICAKLSRQKQRYAPF